MGTVIYQLVSMLISLCFNHRTVITIQSVTYDLMHRPVHVFLYGYLVGSFTALTVNIIYCKTQPSWSRLFISSFYFSFHYWFPLFKHIFPVTRMISWSDAISICEYFRTCFSSHIQYVCVTSNSDYIKSCSYSPEFLSILFNHPLN